MSRQGAMLDEKVGRNNKVKGLAILYLILTSVLLYALLSHWAYDDPFITYRYARNLANGTGFVYNPSERILSTTTPLFTILLAIFSSFWSDIPHLANLIGVVSLALGGVFLWDLAYSWKTPLVGWTALLLYPTFTLLLITMGSETPLYLALCLGSFSLYARKRYTITAVFCALAVLARPDGVLVPVLLGADYLIRGQKPIPWHTILLFLGLTIPWFAFAWVYFGSPLPATLAAKQHQGSMGISQQFLRGLITTIRDYAGLWQYWLASALAFLGIIWMVRQARSWLLFLAWPVIYTISYTILGVSRYFWYYAPLVPGYIVAVGLGISAIAIVIPKRDKSVVSSQSEFSKTERSSLVLLLRQHLPLLIAAVLLGALAFAQLNQLWWLRDQSDPRNLAYQAVGEWLQKNTPSEASIAALEIGIIGYYAERSMVDFAGLLYPEVAAQLNASTTYEDAAMWTVEHYSPDYVVLHKGGYHELKQTYLLKKCEIVQRFPGEPFGYTTQINIFKCD
jgi:hypothetical protein